MIHALPEIVGITASKFPTLVFLTRRPVKVVPKIPSWIKSVLRSNKFFAYKEAIFAHVPVPQGDLSITPFQVSGLSQSNSPVDTTTAFFNVASGFSGGPETTAIVIPEMS